MFLCFRPILWECLTYLEYRACPARDQLTISILGNTSIHFQSYLMLQLASLNHCDYSYRNVQKHKYQNLFCVLLNIQGQIISKPCSIVLRKLPGLTFRKLLLWEYSVQVKITFSSPLRNISFFLIESPHRAGTHTCSSARFGIQITPFLPTRVKVMHAVPS